MDMAAYLPLSLKFHHSIISNGRIVNCGPIKMAKNRNPTSSEVGFHDAIKRTYQ